MSRVADSLLQHGRALEWLTSCVLLAFALTLALPGDTLASSPAFRGFLQFGWDEAAVAVPLALIASMRMAGLYINGNWRRSPLLRLVGAVAGTGIFVWLGMTFAMPYLILGEPALTTGAGVYLTLGVFDLLAAYRAGADAGRN